MSAFCVLMPMFCPYCVPFYCLLMPMSCTLAPVSFTFVPMSCTHVLYPYTHVLCPCLASFNHLITSMSCMILVSLYKCLAPLYHFTICILVPFRPLYPCFVPSHMSFTLISSCQCYILLYSVCTWLAYQKWYMIISHS